MNMETKKIRFSENLDSYKGFIDPDWVKLIDEITKGTVLEESIFELNASWYGISCSRRLPWLMIFSLKSELIGYSKSKKPFPISVIEAFINRITTEIESDNVHMSATARRALMKKFKETHDSLYKAQDNFHDKIDINELWIQLLERPEFSISLWMSEVNAYASLYFAYEICFINCVKAHCKLNRLRIGRDFTDKLKSIIHNDIVDNCWSHTDIEKPRLIRHAIVHNGRKITGNLNKYKRYLNLQNNEIVIYPEDTNELYKVLKERIQYLCEFFLNSS